MRRAGRARSIRSVPYCSHRQCPDSSGSNRICDGCHTWSVVLSLEALFGHLPVERGANLTPQEAKFTDIYDRYHGKVHAYCLRRSDRDQVEDVVANVFLVAWRKIDEIPTGAQALYWLYRVAYRSIGRQWRGSARQRQLKKKLDGLGRHMPIPPEDFVFQDEEAQIVLTAIQGLRPRDREALLLAEWEQLSGPEVAEILDISYAAAKQRIHRARRSLTQEYNRLATRQKHVPAAQEGGAWC